MLQSHPTWRIIVVVCGVLAALGCEDTNTSQQGETGSLFLNLALAGGVQIDEVTWAISANDMDMSGTIKVSAPGSTASVEVFGLPQGTEPYLVELSAVSVDGEVTCEGSAPFNVETGVSTEVMVMLRCKLPQRLGGVRVNGKFNICAELTKVVVSPLQTSVGNDIDLFSEAFDAEGDLIAYSWTSSGGSIANPGDAFTTYTCQEGGEHTVTISVSDNDGDCNMAQWSVPITCVADDGGAGGTGGAGTLGLVQTVPADLATEVPTDIVVTGEFDAALNEATVTTSSFRLGRDGGADVEGSVTAVGQTASYTPARALGLLSSYTATLTTAIEALSGQTLDMSHTWGFRTRDGQWGDPVLLGIGQAGQFADFPPQVALDPNGNAVAVWRQSDGTRYNIWANRFTLAAGWGVPELLETDNAGDAFWPEVALDPNGNAVAVWFQWDGTRYNIWANRFTLAAGWGVAELLETDNAGDVVPQVVLDPTGNAVVVWQQFDGTRYNIWANRFALAAGWGAAELFETDNAGGATAPQVALDPNGNAVVVWNQSDGTRSNIWANRFTPAVGWGVPERIETDNAGSASSPQVATDPNGNAVAVWQQWDGTGTTNIWANRFTLAAGWGVAERIETDNAGNAQAPQVALDSNGNAVAVWQQFDGTRTNIWANRFTLAAGWGAAERIETGNAGGASLPQVALDPNGNAVAVWEQWDLRGFFSIWANRFTLAAGWGAAELLETDNAVMASSPEVDSNGNAIAVWYQSDLRGFRSTWANRFE